MTEAALISDYLFRKERGRVVLFGAAPIIGPGWMLCPTFEVTSNAPPQSRTDGRNELHCDLCFRR